MKGPELDWACHWIIDNKVTATPLHPDHGDDKWVARLGDGKV